MRLVCDRIESNGWRGNPADGSPLDVVLIAAPRLHEMPASTAVAVCERLTQAGRRLVLYAYGDWKRELAETVAAFGLAAAWRFAPPAAGAGVRVVVGQRRD